MVVPENPKRQDLNAMMKRLKSYDNVLLNMVALVMKQNTDMDQTTENIIETNNSTISW